MRFQFAIEGTADKLLDCGFRRNLRIRLSSTPTNLRLKCCLAARLVKFDDTRNCGIAQAARNRNLPLREAAEIELNYSQPLGMLRLGRQFASVVGVGNGLECWSIHVCG